MKENKYDDTAFFYKYSQMDRSVKGLAGAGEWHALKKLLPDFSGKRVLDLGCGFGWHCQYAMDQGASSVVGIDISENMLKEARKKTDSRIQYQCCAMEDLNLPPHSFDVVLSSLAFHYVPSFQDICANVSRLLTSSGSFVFSVEHPVFTAQGLQDWYRDSQGKILHWPVDRYYEEGRRQASFLGESVVKYHRTMTAYINTLLTSGFHLTGLIEPEPNPEFLDTVPGMRDELRRPMMLLISAEKKGLPAK